MKSNFNNTPQKPAVPGLSYAFIILQNTHHAASSFLDIFNSTRTMRRAKGTPTDEEQDLLRAMLIFASSGLDSMVKQIVKDALPTVLNKDEGAQKFLEEFISKKLKYSQDSEHKFLSKVLCSRDSRQVIVQEYIDTICNNSLQSKDQLLKVGSYFNIPSDTLTKNYKLLDEIFNVRNQISHEMDIDFNQPNRSRRPRQRDKMKEYTQEILRIANVFLVEVENRLL